MAFTGVPLDEAAILSTVLEGILYGFSVLMFIGTIWALIYKRGSRNINRPITVVAILLLMLSTAHMVVDIIRAEDGLVKYRDTFPGGPVAFFQDINQNTYVIKNVIWTLQTMLGDGVVPKPSGPNNAVSGKRFIAVMLSGDLSGLSSYQPTMLHRRVVTEAIYFGPIGQWVTTFFALTLSVNLLSSGLLAYRIWTIERKISAARAAKGTMMPIVRVLVDAAALYSAALFSVLIPFICSNNGQYIVSDMITPIISIAFYMVFIRITINRKILGNMQTVTPTPNCVAAPVAPTANDTLDSIIHLDHRASSLREVPPVRKGPIDTLPEELILHIFKLEGSSQEGIDFAALVSHVCRTRRNVAFSCSSFSTGQNAEQGADNVHPKLTHAKVSGFSVSWSQWSLTRPTSLSINPMTFHDRPSMAMLKHVLTTNREALGRFEIQGAIQQSGPLPRNADELPTNLPKLKDLTIGYLSQWEATSFFPFTSRQPALKHLKLCDISFRTGPRISRMDST
ncbi:hypothetical protein EDB19DRAFT_1829210 [Suillus lakei]|nr:hypothetical protein EDB19DRAFT_1829210 [Suillus lakei]